MIKQTKQKEHDQTESYTDPNQKSIHITQTSTKHLTLHRNKKLNKHLTLHNIHRNTFTKTQPVGESNVNGKEKDSSEAVGLELMVISFMQSFLAEYPQG